MNLLGRLPVAPWLALLAALLAVAALLLPMIGVFVPIRRLGGGSSDGIGGLLPMIGIFVPIRRLGAGPSGGIGGLLPMIGIFVPIRRLGAGSSGGIGGLLLTQSTFSFKGWAEPGINSHSKKSPSCRESPESRSRSSVRRTVSR